MSLKAKLKIAFGKKPDEFQNCYAHARSYYDLMSTAQIWTENKSEDEKRLLLSYLIDTILDDICAEMIFQPLLTDTYPVPNYIIFPDTYDEVGERKSVLSSETVDVDLTVSKVLTCPWNNTRTPTNLLNINDNDFEFMQDNHRSVYYTDIELCQVYNGFHSINAGRYLKKGTIKSDVFRFELLYPHYVTDGLYWYNVHSSEKYSKVFDFRLAAVYSLARMRAGY